MSPATLVRFGRVARSSLPFGDAWYETGTADKWKFTGYERDSGAGETGLDYANFRYYASGQGRFMSADLMSGQLLSPQSLNRYSYAVADPVNLVDQLGLDDMWPRCYEVVGAPLACESLDGNSGPDPRRLEQPGPNENGGGPEPPKAKKPSISKTLYEDCAKSAFGQTSGNIPGTDKSIPSIDARRWFLTLQH